MEQYYHKRETTFRRGVPIIEAQGGETHFLNVPDDKAKLEKLLFAREPSIQMGYGAVRCHPKDNYNKSIGRTLALSRARTLIWRLMRIDIGADGSREYCLESDRGDIVHLVTSLESNRVYLISAHSEELNPFDI